jgi:hypothetical protein
MSGLGHSVGWGDIDNDGDPDLALGDQSGTGYWFFRNDSSVFTNVTSSAGLNGQTANKTIFADFTGDNYNDLLIRNFGGFGEHATLFENNGDGTFTDITAASGAYGQQDAARTITFNDYNNDGAIDLFAAGHFEEWVLFENQNCPGNALFINLEGVYSNFNGIGAQADMWIDGQLISRNMLPDPGVQDFSHLRLHFGMGGATVADSLIIYWPSGIVQKLYNVTGQQHITIVEAETTWIDENQNIMEMQVVLSPNPVKDNARLSFNLQAPHVVQANLYTLTGQKVMEILNGPFPKGEQEIAFSTEKLHPGMYLLRIETIETIYCTKMLKQ